MLKVLCVLGAMWPGLAAAQGLDEAMAALENGDDAAAAAILLPLAAADVSDAQNMLAILFLQGRGVPQDPSEAMRLFTRAAELGDKDAQYNLGDIYVTGDIVAADYPRAAAMYRMAALQGFAPAQDTLARMYEQDVGVLQDNIAAHMWFNLAAANGDASAAQDRDILAERMTVDDVSRAQDLARQCFVSQYQMCE